MKQKSNFYRSIPIILTYDELDVIDKAKGKKSRNKFMKDKILAGLIPKGGRL